MDHRASLSAAEREIERIDIRRKKLIETVMNGMAPSEVRDEMNANAARREELKAQLVGSHRGAARPVDAIVSLPARPARRFKSS